MNKRLSGVDCLAMLASRVRLARPPGEKRKRPFFRPNSMVVDTKWCHQSRNVVQQAEGLCAFT